MNVEIREFLCEFTLQIIENCIKLLGFFLFALIKKMEKHRKDRIHKEYSQSLGRMFLPALIIARDYC